MAVAFDGIVIGGGPNGLTCAAYLARAGLRIAVVERNHKVGGGCTTEEVTLPGFRHNLHSNSHSLGSGPVARDLQLERYGLNYVRPEVKHAVAFSDGTAVSIHQDVERTVKSLARFSRSDADRYRELHEKFVVKMRPLFIQLNYSAPLTLDELRSRIKGPLADEFLTYTAVSLYEAVDRNFHHERVRFAVKCIAHAGGLENVPGSGEYFPGIMARLTGSGYALGGASALTNALGRVVEECGGTLICGSRAVEILVEGGRVTGARLADGQVLRATRFVASGVDAPQTVRMVGEDSFGPEISQKVKQYQWAGHSLVTLHLALNQAPDYVAAKFDPAINHAANLFIGADTTEELERSFTDIKAGEIPSRWIGNGACYTLYNPSMAPEGKHAAFWWPFAPYAFRNGGAEAWDERKGEITHSILTTWRSYAPNLDQRNVLATYLFTPLDIERRCINMVRGGHLVGAYRPSQMGASRPTPELAQYRTPVEGLYLCGASSHPGGSVSGAPGYNCANAICDDLGIPPWWTPVPSPQWNG